MKRIAMIAALACALLTVVPAMAQDAAPAEGSDGFGVSMGMTYYSTYLWRGTYNYPKEKSGCFYPSLSYDILGSGIVVGAAMELADNYVLEKNGRVNAPEGYVQQSVDFGVDYSMDLAPITLDLGCWYWKYYRAKDETGTDTSSLTPTITATLDSLVAPFISVTYDYYLDKKNSFDEKTNYNLYYRAGIGHSIELTKEVAVSLELAGGYFDYRSQDLKGFSDVQAKIGLDISAGSVSFANSFNYVYVPKGDFRVSSDKHKFFTEWGVTYSL